jgi:hypothetical protein
VGIVICGVIGGVVGLIITSLVWNYFGYYVEGRAWFRHPEPICLRADSVAARLLARWRTEACWLRVE